MAVTGHNSIILIGQSFSDSECRFQRYDPDAANDEEVGAIFARVLAPFIGIGDTLYIIGGRFGREDGIHTDQIDKFNIRTRRMTPATPLAYPRCTTACCIVAVKISGAKIQHEDGIIICGGENIHEQSTRIVELFIPRQNRMHRLPPMQTSRSAGAAVALPDGRVFVAGGRNTRYPLADGDHASVEFSNLQADWQTASASEFWRQAAPMMNKRSQFSMAYFKGRVIAAGGGPEGQRAELFSPPDTDHPFGQWTPTTSFSNLNTCSSLVICNDRLFAVGSE